MIYSKNTQKLKERASLENLTGCNDIIFEFALWTTYWTSSERLMYVQFTSCVYEVLLTYLILLLVHMNLICFMCNKRNHSICYTTTKYEVHTFKNKNKIIIKSKNILWNFYFRAFHEIQFQSHFMKDEILSWNASTF